MKIAVKGQFTTWKLFYEEMVKRGQLAHSCFKIQLSIVQFLAIPIFFRESCFVANVH